MANNELGESLKARRLEKGLTLLRLSEITGAHQSYLGRIEQGERMPSAPILRKLAGPLGFTEVELLKMAGYLARDEADDQVAKVKREVNDLLTGVQAEFHEALADIQRRVTNL